MSKSRVARTQPHHLWRLLLLWIVLFAAYSNSFDAGLVFDNKPILTEDPRIRAATAENVAAIFHGDYWVQTGTSGLYRPLTTLSYLVNYSILGNQERPPGYHWINLVLHAANATLVYALGFAIFGDASFALALAALWALHPLATESVTNIVGRADLLAALGVLAALWFHLRSEATRWGLAGIAIAQTIGIFSKEEAVILPALLFLYDLSFRRRDKWRPWAYAAAALPIAAFFLLRGASHPNLLINPQENPLVAAGFFTARLTAISVIGRFLWLFLWPAALSADYSYNAIPLFGSSTAADAIALVSVAVCGTALALLFISWRRSKPLFFFQGFFWTALLPTSNLLLLIGAIMAERFLYLPMLGLCGCVVCGLRWLAQHGVSMRPAWAALALVCCAFAARTYARNADWHDGLTLWSSAVDVNPEAARSHNNLGYELEQIPGRLNDAIAEYRVALRIRPDDAGAYFNLGNALMRTRGGAAEAIAAYRSAIQLAPRYVEAHNNLGSALLQASQVPEAIAEFQAALRIRPDYAAAHNNLGNALSAMPGQTAAAIAEFQTAARLDPHDAEAHNNLGNLLSRTPGQMTAAVAEYRMAIQLKPDYAETHNGLANALAQIPGRLPEAIAEYQTALRIRPDYAEAHANLGSALLASGRLQDAIAEYETATRLDPGLADAHYNLANALLRVPGRLPEAIAEFEAVLKIKPDPEVRLILSKLRQSR